MKTTCLIGDPVEHSISNHLFALYAKDAPFEYSHVKLRVDKENTCDLHTAVKGLRALNFAGCNITLPYKQDVIPLIDEVSDEAQAMGAVNTVVNDEGSLTGYNTDGIGALKAIENGYRSITSDDAVVIFGAGGAARAILFEISKKTNKLTVLNRSSWRLEALVDDFGQIGVDFVAMELNEKNTISAIKDSSIVINATSVGMHPNVEDPVLFDAETLGSLSTQSMEKKCFFDAVFNPRRTRFLEVGKELGSTTVEGIYMMIFQGITAFQLWTGETVSEEIIKEAYDEVICHLE